MIKWTRRTLNVILAATLVLGLAAGASPQDSTGRRLPATAQYMTQKDIPNQKRTPLPMHTASRAPEVKISPLDAAVPANAETATFALG
jgi:hypothetical protein